MKSVKTPRFLIAIVVAFILFAVVVPLPYVVLSPGPATDTLGSVKGVPLISISGHATYPTDGELDLTTVSVSNPDARLTAPLVLQAWLRSDTQVVPRATIYPPDQKVADINQQNAEEMKSSQEHATTAALRYLGYQLTSNVAVEAIPAGSPSLGILRAGDVILSIDGVATPTVAQLRAQIALHKAGDVLTAKVNRSGSTLLLQVKVAKSSDGHPVIGIFPSDRYNYPFEVDIRLKDVGGPSAGMMFALGIIEKLAPESLTRKRIVAGTGTIDDDGNVGAIGGIGDKILGAYRHGARIFLAPMVNCSDIHNVPTGMQVAGVRTLKDAVNVLQSKSVAASASVNCGTRSRP